jgi:aquaporin Z
MKPKDKEGSQSSAHRRMLKKQAAPDFLDSALEWCRMFAEIWGTFLRVLVAAGDQSGIEGCTGYPPRCH